MKNFLVTLQVVHNDYRLGNSITRIVQAQSKDQAEKIAILQTNRRHKGVKYTVTNVELSR